MSVGQVGGNAGMAAAQVRQDASIAGLNLAQNAQKAEGQAAVALLQSASETTSHSGKQGQQAQDSVGADGHLDVHA